MPSRFSERFFRADNPRGFFRKWSGKHKSRSRHARGRRIAWNRAVLCQPAVSPGKDPAEAEKIFYAELERMKNEPVTDAEMQKVRMMVRRSDVEQLEGTLGRARSLGENAVFYNDPNVINSSQRDGE